jgi:hypothetical protein
MIGCENEKVKAEIDTIEESFTVENIEFQDKTGRLDALLFGSKFDGKVLISTDRETLVLYLDYVTFYKTDNAESTIDIQKKIKDEDSINIGFKDDVTAEVYLSKDDVKRVSQKYASLYSQTLEFKVAN